ncbi:MAG: hypothetical protein FJ399_20375, partial [Verrucomicrobia bacterium]|nr:hypothetical protein [Verrucomicrobiota bacterium]
MEPAQRGSEGAAGSDAAVVGDGELARVDGGAGGGKGAELAPGVGRAPVAGEDAVDREGLRTGGKMLAQHAVGEAEHEAVVAGGLPVDRGGKRLPRGILAAVAPREGGKLRVIRGGGGQAVGGGGGDGGAHGRAAPLHRSVGLRRVLERIAARDGEAEILRHGYHGGDIEARMDLVAPLTPAGAGRAAEKGALRILHQPRNAVIVGGATALKRAAR